MSSKQIIGLQNTFPETYSSRIVPVDNPINNTYRYNSKNQRKKPKLIFPIMTTSANLHEINWNK